jgi:uncharacterized protein with HEPN domain
MDSADGDANHLEIILRMIADLHRRLQLITPDKFADDGDERDLTAFRLSVIGENANKLTDALKARHPSLPWREMYAFRNLVSHDYMVIASRFVWAATQELEPIRAMCEIELERMEAKSRPPPSDGAAKP